MINAISNFQDTNNMSHTMTLPNQQRRTMFVNISREYNISRVLLSCLGLWPFQSKLGKRLLPLIPILLTTSILPLEILTLYKHRDDGELIFECTYQIIITTIFIIKAFNQLLNYNKIRRLCENMETHWCTLTSQLEVEILKKYSHLAHQYTVSYMVIMYVFMALFITIPSLGPMLLDIIIPLNQSREKHVALYNDYGIDEKEYFVPIFLYSTLFIIFGMSVLIATDNMHVTCTLHACSIFRIIGFQLENILSDVRMSKHVNKTRFSTNKEYEMFIEEMAYQQYIVCLKKHQFALEYVDILNDTYKFVGITFTLFIGAVTALMGVRLVYVIDQPAEMFRFICPIAGSLLHLLMVCYTSQRLMDESENIFHRAYSAEWYYFSSRLKSLLVITCQKSIEPSKVTAGNLFPLSMRIFGTVVRTSASYFTTLLSLKA